MQLSAPLFTDIFNHQLDVSTACRYLKLPRSLCDRSLHLTLVTKWSWSWMTYSHPPLFNGNRPSILRYSYLKISIWKSLVKVMCMVKDQGYIWPWKYKNQGNGQGQTHWSHLRKCKVNVTTKIDENLIKSNQVIYRLGPAIVPNMKEIQKVVQKLSREQESRPAASTSAAAAAALYELV